MASEATLRKMSRTLLIQRAADLTGKGIDVLEAADRDTLVQMVLDAQANETVSLGEGEGNGSMSSANDPVLEEVVEDAAETNKPAEAKAYEPTSMKGVRATIRRYLDNVVADPSTSQRFAFMGNGQVLPMVIEANSSETEPYAFIVGGERITNQKQAYRTIGLALGLEQPKAEKPQEEAPAEDSEAEDAE